MGSASTSPTATPPAERDRWRTPPAWFAKLAHQYGPFDLDAAAEAHNALCPRWLGPGSPLAEDALAVHWGGLGATLPRVWCNPPYSLARQFVEKASAEARAGRARTTLLLPATTGVRWFQQCVWDAPARRFRIGVEVQFVAGRIEFLRPDGATAGTPTFASVIVTFLA
jgi:DNA (cytosine-5)-methyltransferase 1